MREMIRNLAVVSAGCLFAVAGLSGCATASKSIESGEELARASETGADTVVFGKLRLISNGKEVELGEGIFAKSATLQLRQPGAGQEIQGKVGREGEFAWVLEPGYYSVSSIGLKYHGETVEPQTNFRFSVSADHKASYVGTITLEASFDPGYFGLRAMVDRYTVKNECAANCERRLAQLGLSGEAATVSLAHWEERMADRN